MTCAKDLHTAASEGDVECVKELLKHRMINPNIKDRRGWMPLHYAVNAGHYDIVWLLLDYGANPNARVGDWTGKTPLHLAVRNQNYDIAELLLNAGAKPDARDEWGRSPLHEAASSGNFLITHLLIERGANVNAVDVDGRTPLHEAIINLSPKEPKEKRLERRGVVAEA
jgi:cytohesin